MKTPKPDGTPISDYNFVDNNPETTDLYDANFANQIIKEIEAIKKRFNVDLAYPVGSIYISVVNKNPNLLFGGTWRAFAAGRTLVGIDSSQTEFNTVKKTGGAKTHSLTAKENGPHNHKLHMAQNPGPYSSPPYGTGGYEWVDSTNVVSLSGEGAPHNNLQPYITVYMWERIS